MCHHTVFNFDSSAAVTLNRCSGKHTYECVVKCLSWHSIIYYSVWSTLGKVIADTKEV